MDAAICLEVENGYEVITVDIDGSPGFTGAVLYAKYQTLSRVKKLIKLGDLYELHETLKPTDNLGHYILKEVSKVKEGNKVKEISKVKEVKLQEGVCVSKQRDTRQFEGDTIKKAGNFSSRFYKYKSPFLVWLHEGVDYVYVFNPELEQWSTYAQNTRTTVKEIKVDYHLYIKNLIYRDDLSELTREEKERLEYVKWRCDRCKAR